MALPQRRSERVSHRVVLAAIAGLQAICLVSAAAAAPPAADDPNAAVSQAHEAWRSAIMAVPVPDEGCFRAGYPNAAWVKVPCKVAPARPYIPRSAARNLTVGNGNDYAAVTAGLTKSALGSFPVVKGVKSEKGYDGAPNTYSLQLNSGFMTTAGCKGAADPADCLTWEQFVYSSSSNAAFMQYWLIGYGNKCPASWASFEGDCYKNSAAADVPQIPITSLHGLKIEATAVAGHLDSLVMTTPTEAYTITGKDSVVDLATAWNNSEFNVVGDGGGSQAKFNKGSSVTVEIGLRDGAKTAPTCKAEDGTTGETNNLTLGTCSTTGGAIPAVKFTEAN
jgi:hypothetical protein